MSADALRAGDVRRSAAGSLRTGALVVVFTGLLCLQFAGTAALAVGYLVVVCALVVAWALVLDPPGREGVSAIGVLVAVLVTLLSINSDGGETILLVGAVVSLVCAMVLQIVRRPPRPGVVASLSSTATLGMIVVAGATLFGIREGTHGRELTALYLGAVGATLLVGRLCDMVLPRPVSPGRVGWPGLVIGVLAGVGTVALVATMQEAVSESDALLVGLAAALSAAALSVVTGAAVSPRRASYSDAILGAALPLLAAAPSAVLLSGVIGS